MVVGHADLVHELHKQRQRVLGQRLGHRREDLGQQRKLLVVRNVLDGSVELDHSETGTALVPWDLDSHHEYLRDARLVAGAQLVLDLRRRHVLGLPAEGVAHTVEEVPHAVLVLAQQVAAAVPGVALAEHVAHDLRPRLLLVAQVPLERGLWFAREEDAHHHLAGLVERWLLAQALAVAVDARVVLGVHPHQHLLEGEEPLDHGAVVAARADAEGAALVVRRREGSLRGSVELAHDLDVEPQPEWLPNIRSQTVAKGHLGPVQPLVFGHGRVQQVAADLANVLHVRCLSEVRLFPVVGGGELGRDGDAPAL